MNNLSTSQNLKNQWLEHEKNYREALSSGTDPSSIFKIIQDLFVDLVKIENNSELNSWIKERDKIFVNDVKKKFHSAEINYINMP